MSQSTSSLWLRANHRLTRCTPGRRVLSRSNFCNSICMASSCCSARYNQYHTCLLGTTRQDRRPTLSDQRIRFFFLRQPIHPPQLAASYPFPSLPDLPFCQHVQTPTSCFTSSSRCTCNLSPLSAGTLICRRFSTHKASSQRRYNWPR